MLVVADNYLKIIDEIRNLEKGALDDYIHQKLIPFKNENKVFIETLYKYIVYVLRDVDEPEDNDLVNENGNWPVFDSNGEMKLTGYQTRLHDIQLWLQRQMIEKISINKPFNHRAERERFENDLRVYTFTPELRKKLDAINSSIKQERKENYELPRSLISSDTKPQQTTEPIKIPVQEKKISAPIIAMFCNLISQTKIIEKLDYENVAVYCKKVCDKYKLKYTERVRITFNDKHTIRNISKLKELVLPKIDKDSSKILTEYLANRNK